MDDSISRTQAIQVMMDEDVDHVQGISGREVIQILMDLRAAQPEQTDCEYCHEDIEGYVKPIEKNGHAFVCFGIDGWELNLRAKGWHGEAKIRFCPMCGRRLT